MRGPDLVLGTGPAEPVVASRGVRLSECWLLGSRRRDACADPYPGHTDRPDGRHQNDVCREPRSSGTRLSRLLGEGEIAAADDPNVEFCLRLITIAGTTSKTISSSREPCTGVATKTPMANRKQSLLAQSALSDSSTCARFGRGHALSLERGTLLRQHPAHEGSAQGNVGAFARVWRLSNRPLTQRQPNSVRSSTRLRLALRNTSLRVATDGRRACLSRSSRASTSARPSRSSSRWERRGAVPFQQAGTGTLATLVLALLTFIADIKRDNVIFAMEEPEIACRRIRSDASQTTFSKKRPVLRRALTYVIGDLSLTRHRQSSITQRAQRPLARQSNCRPA